MKIDNENVRASNRCPLCEGEKDIGLVTCWPCYRLYGLRYGNPEAENKIEQANETERQLYQLLKPVLNRDRRPTRRDLREGNL